MAQSSKIKTSFNIKQAVYEPRRHYSPRSISQQAEVEETTEVDDDGLLETQNAVNVNDVKMFSLNDATIVSNEPPIAQQGQNGCRTLGGLEHMCNMYTINGAEVVCLMTKVETVYPISECKARDALLCLLRRHPLLRMGIRPCPGSVIGEFAFSEKKPLTYDFHSSNRFDWLPYLLEEASRPFNDGNLPLFRCRLLNSSQTTVLGSPKKYSNEEFAYQATFLFIVHHSIMDGGYCLWMFQEYINFLDALSTGHNLGKVKKLQVYPPVEMCLPSPSFISKHLTSAKTDAALEYSVCFGHDVATDTHRMVLRDYRRNYSKEIERLSALEPRNGCITFELTRSETVKFKQMFKARGCTAKGALVSAFLLSLLDLIYGETELKNVKVPLEYMMDLRRFCNLSSTGELYPGLASVHMPITVQISRAKVPLTPVEFWRLSAVIDNYLTNEITDSELFKFIEKESKQYSKYPQQKVVSGKSPFVLCVSNMGDCNRVLNDDVSKRVRLIGLHGHSTVLVDDMPLFSPSAHSLNGQLWGNVSYCESYTSLTTANMYVGLIKKYLTCYSKL